MNPFGVGMAHGKIIWFGEHAVVYHHPAIALPLNEHRIHIKMDPSSTTELISPFFNGPLETSGFEGLIALMKRLREILPLGDVTIELRSDIPVGAGLGASAAIASAIVSAAFDLTDQPLDAGTHFELIQLSESYFHTNPSGIDAYLSIHDHALRYRKDQSPDPIDIDLDAHLVVAYSNVKGSTKEAVEIIADQMNVKKASKLVADLGHITLGALEAIQAKSLHVLGRLMNEAHALLKRLGVSHATLDALTKRALESGALGAKLSGGGLGGIMIALFDDKTRALSFQTSLQNDGFSHVFIKGLSA